MHVALFSPSWPLVQYPNGVVTYVHWMREELRRQGHRVSIFTGTLGQAEDDVYEIRSSSLSALRERIRARFRSSDEPTFDLSVPIADTVNEIHRRTPIDVIEMEESWGWAGGVARRTGIPVVVKLHGPAFMSLVEEELHTPLAARKILAEGRALHRLPVITSPAKRTLEDTVAHYQMAPHYARHVVNPLLLPDGTPLWTLAGCDIKAILFVGRFDKRKGGDIVLRAFAQLLAADPALKLIFVGPDAGIPEDGGRRVFFEEMKAMLFPGAAAAQITYLGKRTPAEIYRLRPSALVTVIASRWENQSYTALEAMLQGCPVVSSESGGQGEIIDDGRSGLLAVAGDVESLADRLDTLLADPEAAARMGAQARRYVLEQHAPALVVRQSLEAYAEAIAIGRSGGR